MSANPDTPWISSPEAIRERMRRPWQVASSDPEAAMPPYMDAFLANLRLLVGVPFTYLVPHPALLPPESIRFFYVDQSWTDRLVDGAIAVGKTGTREQAHHQAHHDAVRQQLDVSATQVRAKARGIAASGAAPAGDSTITGFLLRSSAVAGWPHMDVHAYGSSGDQLPTLRLELLSPAIMIGLFRGVPTLVTFEEPHHALQFGAEPDTSGALYFRPRGPDGKPRANQQPIHLSVRAADTSVLSIESLVGNLQPISAGQTASAKLALLALRGPYRQPFTNATTTTPGGGSVLLGARQLLDQAVAFETEQNLNLMDPNAPVEDWGPVEGGNP
jgi:hypothetical protein